MCGIYLGYLTGDTTDLRHAIRGMVEQTKAER